MVGNWRARHCQKFITTGQKWFTGVGLDQGAFDELTPLIDPAAVASADLVLIARTNIGLEHHGGVGGLN